MLTVREVRKSWIRGISLVGVIRVPYMLDVGYKIKKKRAGGIPILVQCKESD